MNYFERMERMGKVSAQIKSWAVGVALLLPVAALVVCTWQSWDAWF